MIYGICRRVLKNQKSRENGYGPVCYRKAFGAPPKKDTKKNETEADRESIHEPIPGQMDITDFIKD